MSLRYVYVTGYTTLGQVIAILIVARIESRPCLSVAPACGHRTAYLPSQRRSVTGESEG